MKSVAVNPPIQKTLGILLRELRKQKLKMSQERFAQAIGADQSSISRWETGATTPMLTFDQVKALLREMRRAGLDPVDDLPDGLTNEQN